MDKLTRSISQSLLENNFIGKDDVELCQYGIEMFIICVLEMTAILLLSVIIGNFIETVIYMLAFIPMRVYSGGYHADTRLRCFIILLAVYAAFSIINRYNFFIEFSIFILIALLLNILFVYMWSPLPNRNKTVNEKQLHHYRKMSILLSVIGTVITSFIVSVNIYNNYTQAFLLGLFTAFISLIVGKIKNLMKGDGSNE